MMARIVAMVRGRRDPSRRFGEVWLCALACGCLHAHLQRTRPISMRGRCTRHTSFPVELSAAGIATLEQSCAVCRSPVDASGRALPTSTPAFCSVECSQMYDRGKRGAAIE